MAINRTGYLVTLDSVVHVCQASSRQSVLGESRGRQELAEGLVLGKTPVPFRSITAACLQVCSREDWFFLDAAPKRLLQLNRVGSAISPCPLWEPSNLHWDIIKGSRECCREAVG